LTRCGSGSGDEGLVRNKAVCVALARNGEGEKEVLGLWIEQTEGAKFWLKVMNELKTRGVNDVLIAVVDGLKGFPEAIGAVFPLTTVQTCIIHLIRNSLAFVSWKDRKLIMPDLKAIYRAETADAAAAELDAFEAEWGRRYPAIGQAWRRAWQHVVPLFAFPPAIRKMIYTTDEIDKPFRRELLSWNGTGDRMAKELGSRMRARPRCLQRRSSVAAPVRCFALPRRCHLLTNCS